MKQEFYTEEYFDEAIKRQIRYNLVARENAWEKPKNSIWNIKVF